MAVRILPSPEREKVIKMAADLGLPPPISVTYVYNGEGRIIERLLTFTNLDHRLFKKVKKSYVVTKTFKSVGESYKYTRLLNTKFYVLRGVGPAKGEYEETGLTTL